MQRHELHLHQSLRILLLLDGSAKSVEVATYARAFAQAHSGEASVVVDALCVYPRPAFIHYAGYYWRGQHLPNIGLDVSYDLLDEHSRIAVAAIEKAFEGVDFTVKVEYAFGYLPRIARARMEAGLHDLVILGDYRYRWLGKFAAGWMTRDIVSAASCPVLIVK